MFSVDAIYPVSDFSRKPAEHIKRLKQTGEPEILTINGKAELVIQNAKAYEQMVDLLVTLEKISNAADDIDKNKSTPVKTALKDLRKRLLDKYQNETI